MGPALSAATHLPRPPRIQAPQALVSSSSSSFCLVTTMMNSICLDESSDTDADWDQLDHSFTGFHAPSANSPDLIAQPQQYHNGSDDSDEEYGTSTQVAPRKGGYDSRIQQYLYEYPNHPIMIVDGGKSLEGGGKYIVYTIKTGVSLLVIFWGYYLQFVRSWKSGGGILSLHHSEMPSLDYTPP